MPTSYYLACLDTYHFVWIGRISAPDPAAGVELTPVTLFCLAHRNKPLTVVGEMHSVVSEDTEWDESSASALFGALVERNS